MHCRFTRTWLRVSNKFLDPLLPWRPSSLSLLGFFWCWNFPTSSWISNDDAALTQQGWGSPEFGGGGYQLWYWFLIILQCKASVLGGGIPVNILINILLADRKNLLDISWTGFGIKEKDLKVSKARKFFKEKLEIKNIFYMQFLEFQLLNII